MNEMIVGILGFLTIVSIVVTLFKSKTLPSIALSYSLRFWHSFSSQVATTPWTISQP